MAAWFRLGIDESEFDVSQRPSQMMSAPTSDEKQYNTEHQPDTLCLQSPKHITKNATVLRDETHGSRRTVSLHKPNLDPRLSLAHIVSHFYTGIRFGSISFVNPTTLVSRRSQVLLQLV